LRDRLKKICDSFHGDNYDLPRSQDEISESLNKTKAYLDNLYSTLKLTIDNYKKYLVQIQHSKLSEGFSLIKTYKQYLLKDKCIYRTMNKFKADKSLLVGLFWVPNKFS
jgi:vacuolar-type H+-ATPase subunit I/STV1